ncbi:MAG: HNH endonuclease, partial [Actinomycetota bacterium]|nr:HNH endonuclease [Actinomycetota bacterium]
AADGLARTARREPGETRTLAQLRVDLLAGIAADVLAAGGYDGLALPAGRHRSELHVTVGADTLLGVTDAPGWLAGYGPIPAEMARRIATDATWRRVLTDPVTGAMLDYATATHDPGAVLAGHVVTRDQTRVTPVCTRPAAGCDLDHTVRYPDGPTDETNLGPLCRHDHGGKHAGFGLEQPQPGHFVWTTPTGRVTARARPALAEPRPDWHRRQQPRAAGTDSAAATAPELGTDGKASQDAVAGERGVGPRVERSRAVDDAAAATGPRASPVLGWRSRTFVLRT